MKRIYLLYGPIGAGKTTFVRNFLHNDMVVSPTFSLCNVYEINGKTIAHFDLYRHIDYELLLNALEEHSMIFIEWSELLNEKFIEPFQKEIVKIYF